jgi:P27 family predicted phage terminase small subunit
VAPKGLGRSGKAVWKQVAGAVWLSPADHRTLESLARTLDQCDELQKLLDRDGLILSKPITDRTGQIVGSEAYAHPALAALRSAERRTEALRRELALSPGARIRLGLDVLAAQAAEKAATERIRAGARKLAGA